jgi:hypothetical protein
MEAHTMLTSAECRKKAETKINLAERARDERRSDVLISAANAWLMLAHGIRQLEINAEAHRRVVRRASAG